MSGHSTSDDLRSRKTEKALFGAMFSLLRRTSFRKMTIKGICEEALISRAAFYAHYIDKYDLLKHWMSESWPKELDVKVPYEQLEKAVNRYIQENMMMLKNLLYDADDETFIVLFDFLLSTIELSLDNKHGGEIRPKNVALSNFYAGGMISYLLWQIKNKFPADVPVMNRYFYEIMCDLQDRHAKKGDIPE